MQTTINWREYPDQKPDMADSILKPFSVIKNGEPTGAWYYPEKGGFPEGVTHFALPEDITTTDTQKEGEE